VNVALTTISVYAISGFCAGMGGLITTSRLMVGYPSAGTGNELFFSIAAAVVGGVSLFGAMLGALLIATISNGMTLLSVPSFWQPLVIGLIILFGVIVDTYRRRFSEVRRAVQVLRSKAAGKPVRDERGARTPVVKNVTEEQGASQSNFRSGSLKEDRS
jgi:ribose/xylose/arabinose/galactoside ABC-type transport system permease subunit